VGQDVIRREIRHNGGVGLFNEAILKKILDRVYPRRISIVCAGWQVFYLFILLEQLFCRLSHILNTVLREADNVRNMHSVGEQSGGHDHKNTNHNNRNTNDKQYT